MKQAEIRAVRIKVSKIGTLDNPSLNAGSMGAIDESRTLSFQEYCFYDVLEMYVVYGFHALCLKFGASPYRGWKTFEAYFNLVTDY